MERIIPALDVDGAYRHLEGDYRIKLEDTHLDFYLYYKLQEDGIKEPTIGKHEGFMLRKYVCSVSIDFVQENYLYTLTISSSDGVYVSFNFGANRFDEAVQLKEEIKSWALGK